MRFIRKGTWLIVLLVVPKTLDADFPRTHEDYRFVEPSGRFYVVVSALRGSTGVATTGNPVKITIAERKKYSPEVIPARSIDLKTGKAWENPDVRVRPGDTIHGEVILDSAPLSIILSSSGLGFVAVDVRSPPRNVGPKKSRHSARDALVIVSNDGQVRLRKKQAELFTATEMNQFRRSVSEVFWFGGGWIDELRSELVVVGGETTTTSAPPAFRVVKLETGAVRQASCDVVVTALRERNQGAFELALQLSAKLRLKDAESVLCEIMDDEMVCTALKSRAAVALIAVGNPKGENALRDAAINTGDSYAIRNLALLRRDGAKWIRDTVARHGRSVREDAVRALVAIGSDALPTLLEMLENATDPEGQCVAADAARDLATQASAAVPALVRILRGHTTKQVGHWAVERSAARALGHIGRHARSAIPALKEFRLRAKADLDDRIARAVSSGVGSDTVNDSSFMAAVEALKLLESPKSSTSARDRR